MQGNQGGARQELLISIRRLSDDELVVRVKSLAARERRATALLVAHLAELETRDVHLRAGYSSLFTYCRDVLALSEHEAYNRIEAARTARRFPVVLDLLGDGSVNLTTVRLLGPHLTAENHASVLDSARGKRKGEVEEIVARLSPRVDVAASVRKLPEPRTASLRVVAPEPPRVASMAFALVPGVPAPAARVQAGEDSSLGAAQGPLAPPADPLSSAETPPPPASAVPLTRRGRSGEVTPLSPDRYRYQLTIGGTTLEKLRLAKDMLRHALPSGDDEAVLDRALTALLTDLARKKFAAEEKTRSSRKQAPGSRHVPAWVKRVVWVRDLGRCAFPGTDGRRCGERAFVEFHHVRPYAVGGEASVENIQLRCRRHNGYEARVFFARDPVREGSGLSPNEAGRGSGLVPERAVPCGFRALLTRDREVVLEEAPG